MMTKIASILLFVVSTANSWCQPVETDSIRWIRVYKSEINAKLFEFSGMNDSTLIGSISKSAYHGEPVFFFESKDISDKTPQYLELIKFPVIDSLDVDPSITITWDLHYRDVRNAIVFAYSEDHPLSDVYGDPIIIHCGGGMLCFIYPPETYTVTPIPDITEIRIKEKRVFNEVLDQYEFVPLAIQLMPQLVSKMDYTIWLDLDKMRKQTPTSVNHEWYTFIENRSYLGEQYMQLKNDVH